MPTQTLEDAIRALAARGEISDLSLSMNSSHTKWRACLVPCSQFGMSVAEDTDPIKALTLAMSVKLTSKKVRIKDDPHATVIEQPTVEVEDIEALM